MINSILKSIFIAIAILLSVSTNAQQIDTLQFNKNSFVMFDKVEFEKLANPDTCITDISGNYIFLNYKGKEYFGISKAEITKILAKRSLKNSVKSLLLYDPNKNTIWGYRNGFSVVTEIKD